VPPRAARGAHPAQPIRPAYFPRQPDPLNAIPAPRAIAELAMPSMASPIIAPASNGGAGAGGRGSPDVFRCNIFLPPARHH
jgi:hypothetical protein